MAVLSLSEAAEQAAASRVDIWRAIQDGALPAKKTTDGGYAIDPIDLFCVFESKEPGPRLTAPELTPAPAGVGPAKINEASELTSTNDLSVAFLALQAELESLLSEAARPREEMQHEEAKMCSDDPTENDARLAADPGAEKAKTEKVIAEHSALADKLEIPAETRRPRWRWLMGCGRR